MSACYLGYMWGYLVYQITWRERKPRLHYQITRTHVTTTKSHAHTLQLLFPLWSPLTFLWSFFSVFLQLLWSTPSPTHCWGSPLYKTDTQSFSKGTLRFACVQSAFVFMKSMLRKTNGSIIAWCQQQELKLYGIKWTKWPLYYLSLVLSAFKVMDCPIYTELFSLLVCQSQEEDRWCSNKCIKEKSEMIEIMTDLTCLHPISI